MGARTKTGCPDTASGSDRFSLPFRYLWRLADKKEIRIRILVGANNFSGSIYR
jgi:hypothetical protein